MSLKFAVVALSSLSATALAHGYIPGFVSDGVWNQGFLLDYYYEIQNGITPPDIAAWYAEDLDSGFVAPDAYGTADINCHINSDPGALTESVTAGGTVEFQWTVWPHNIGPVLTYVAACDGDCSAVDKTELLWVKIDESGIDYDTQTWASQVLIDQNSTWTTTVPSTLKAGNYVFRHEIIALHGASSVNGAQNYPFCFNIAIVGSGTDEPVGTLGTELYREDDPGIYFNPYTTITDYAMPGPTLYTGDSGGSGGTTTSKTTTTTAGATTTSQASSTASTTLATKASTTGRTVSPTTTSSSGQSLYGQCGGDGWTGPITCASGTVSDS
ncbi:glycosyl hydrolase family 61-domain-containing protein [Xylariaceae sp. FL1019]|nr:glycosyl hydrolase family 61-domain-containing protein [Xylariaceae sp. FL1019]